MTILNKSGELTSKQMYDMVMGQGIQKMKDAVGQVIEVQAWVHYEDVNQDGVIQELLSIYTEDGEVFATNSKTFRTDFLQMVEFFNSFGEQVKAINVISGTSKGNREFITCTHNR